MSPNDGRPQASEVPEPTRTLPDGTPSRDQAGPERIGRYKIRRKIGEGGMGAVYEAEQEKPKRHVALKVIRPGLLSARMLQRFEQEAQILGRLQHPGVAQIYEAGTADTGLGTQPFFAMEYVQGANLRNFADKKKLSTRERLGLLAAVCEAVHHAHQKGVIHRDLKPGNILVNEAGQPKILDFGVARVTDSDVQVTTIQTDVGQLIGTLPYMSPEQIAADPEALDTRSDVYALGVIAYELLAGHQPYDLRQKMIHEAARIIREDDPTPLSSISKVFRGDVETIVAKAMEKDKTRRYQSAAGLAEDIRRYLHDEPIAAHPASTIYQLKKFAKRNRALVTGVVVAFVAVLSGAIASSVLYFRAERARVEAESARLDTEAARAASDRDRIAAEEARDNAEAVVGFQAYMLASVNPEERGKDVTVRAILDEAAKTVGDQFSDKPLIEARLRQVMAKTYFALGLYEDAEQHATIAARIRQRELGASHPDTLTAVNGLAVSLWAQGKFESSGELNRDNYEMRRRVLGEEHQDTLRAMDTLANSLMSQGKYAEAGKLKRDALEIMARVLGKEHPHTLASANNLAINLYQLGHYEEAEKLLRKTYEVQCRILGEENPQAVGSLSNIAVVLYSRGRFAETEKLLRKIIEIRSRVLGEEHKDTLVAMSNLIGVLDSRERYAEAAELGRNTLATLTRVRGTEHPATLDSMTNLAAALGHQGNLTESAELLVNVVETRRRLLGHDHPSLADPLLGLAKVRLEQREPQQALILAQNALAVVQKALPEDHPTIATARGVFGECLMAMSRYDESEAPLLESYQKAVVVQGESGPQTVAAIELLVELYDSWNMAEPGKGYDAKAADWRAKLPKTDKADTV